MWRRSSTRLTMPCPVPTTPNGVYHHFQRAVVSREDISHGEVIMLTCLPGFQQMGPDSLRCWYGEWAVDNLPECVPSKNPAANLVILKENKSISWV
ncbi:hypothetical protein AVEN_142320-1 [Araneus ventricosus]|uniref:Sushi domain-containing protein n=1 Tax=Araneus ventricosus TaxID=182803 RepID=A0A4Y2KSW3_ARAVE|nr:hypothetical protein AVEN_142320-1 [Araneus ventricosus]